MTRIVINTKHGGFGLSNAAKNRYAEIKAIDESKVSVYEIARDDAALIQVVDEIGATAGGCYAELNIIEIPDNVNWQIEEYDGLEWVAEVHRVWGI